MDMIAHKAIIVNTFSIILTKKDMFIVKKTVSCELKEKNPATNSRKFSVPVSNYSIRLTHIY